MAKSFRLNSNDLEYAPKETNSHMLLAVKPDIMELADREVVIQWFSQISRMPLLRMLGPA